MPTQYKIPKETEDLWSSIRKILERKSGNSSWLDILYPKTAKESLQQNATLSPAFTKSEFREAAAKAFPKGYSSETVNKLLNYLEEGLSRLPESWYSKLKGPMARTKGGYFNPYGKGEIGLGFDEMLSNFSRTKNPIPGQFTTGHEIGHGAILDLSKKLNMSTDKVVQELLPDIFKGYSKPYEGLLKENPLRILSERLSTKAGIDTPFKNPYNRAMYWNMKPEELGADLVGLHAANVPSGLDFFKQIMELLK